MPYAILRFEKRKGGPASAIEKHHERKKEHYGSNPDIDRERTELNYHLIQPRLQYYSEIQTRIEKAQRENPQCKVRKDSVKFIDTIVTATPEYFAKLPPEEVRRYFEHALDFLKSEVGEENIFSAVVHMDKRNPHMHLCFMPLTRDILTMYAWTRWASFFGPIMLPTTSSCFCSRTDCGTFVSTICGIPVPASCSVRASP